MPTEKPKFCECGSGMRSYWYYDARGIELCRACVVCWPVKRKAYRPEVLIDANYEAMEDIEPDDGSEV